MISDLSITDLTLVGRNSTRCGYGTVEQCGKIIKEYCKYSFSHTVSATLATVPRAERNPREETEFGAAGSGVSI